MAKQSFDPDQSPPLAVLLTRPEAQAQVFAQRLRERFGARVQPVIAPLMVPHVLSPDLPTGDIAAVIFTSATAVAASGALHPRLPRLAFCVGDQTATAAHAAGFHPISANGDANALFALILADPPQGRLLHLRGQDARGDLAERLTAAGIPALDLVVYRQDPQPLTPQALVLLQKPGPVILPLFSPRSAVLMANALPAKIQARLLLAALSPAVAKAAAAIPHARLVTAARPDADGMLDALANLIVTGLSP